MVAPITGPRTTPSRTAMRAGHAGEIAAHSRELARRPALGPGAPDTTRSSAGFAAHHEIADVEIAFLRRLVLRRRVHRHPHLAAEHARIHVGEAEQRAGVVGLEIDHLVIVARAQAQVADERRVAADLGVQRETADVPGRGATACRSSPRSVSPL